MVYQIKKYDIVTCVGVLTISDDIERLLRNLADLTNNSGRIVLFRNFNPEPIDVIIRACRSDHSNGEMHTRYNCFSKLTFEQSLVKIHVLSRSSGFRLIWIPPFPKVIIL